MRNLFIIGAFLFTAGNVSAQAYSWSGVYNGGTEYKQFFKTKSDASNNVYIAGLFVGSVDFDPGAGVDIRTSNGGQDVFLTKLDANGNYLWTKTFGSAKNEYLSDLEITSTKLIVAGEFWETVNFDPDGGVDNQVSAGATDVYLWNIAFDGSYLGTDIIGAAGPDDIGSVHANAADEIFITGRFFENVDFNLQGGGTVLTAPRRFAQYIVKYNSTMNLQWARMIDNEPDRETLCIKTDGTGNVGIIGEFFGTVDFNPGPGSSFQVTTNPNNNQMFYLRLDANGNFLNVGNYSVRLRGADFEYDAIGNAHIVGNFIGEITVNGNNLAGDDHGGFYFRAGTNTNPIGTPTYYEGNGSIDAVRGISRTATGFTILVNSENGTGNALPGMSIIRFGTTQNFMGSTNIPNIHGQWLDVDANDDITIVGGITEIADVDPGAGVVNLQPQNGMSGFVVKYN